MKRRAFAIFVAAIAMASLAASALAGSITNTGKVSGAPDSVVSLNVVKSGGKPRKIKAFRVAKAPAHCDGGAGTVSQRFAKTLIVAPTGRFHGTVVSSGGPGGFFKLSGKVKNGGKKVTGTLSIDKSFAPPKGECKTGIRSWSAKSG